MTDKKKPPKGRTWKPGQSGNPKGRTPGTGEVAKIRQAIASRIPEVLESLVVRALDGDVGAARLLLERTVAPLKAIEPAMPIAMPGDTLTEKARSVLDALARGEVSAGQAVAMLGAVGALARVVEVDELAARVAALEGKKP